MHTATRDAAGVRITALYTDRGEAAARICLDVAADAVSFYRDWLGLYPHRFLFIVPWGAGVWGGFPWAPGIAAIHGEEAFDPDKHTEHFKWITAHEIGHQYWGWYVLDPDDPPWLWIGMGIYADHEYAQARLGSTWKHEQYLDRYLEGVRRLYDTTLEITPNREEAMSFDRNNYVIHAKGFAVIWALEGVLGREAFQDLYRRCLRHFAHRPMGLRDLWTYIEAETGQDLDWFFEQWARSDKYLLYEVTSTECHPEGGAFVSRILITRRGDMAMPIPVRIHFADGTTQEAIVNRLAKQTVLELASASELERVELDPERHFAMLTEPIPLSPELLDRRASRLSTWSPDLDEALDIYAGAVTLDLQSSAVWRKLGIVLARRQAEQALDCWQRYSALVETPADRFHAAAWLGLIEDTLGHREQALSHYRQALDAYDGTRTWPYSQYGFRISRAWVEQRLTEPLRWQDA